MEPLDKKDYCLMLLGAENHPIDDILRISETIPNTMAYNSQDVIVATFSSYLNIKEVTTYIKSYNINFFVFEINTNNFGRNITDAETDKELFGFIKPKRKTREEFQERIQELFDNPELARKFFQNDRVEEQYQDAEEIINSILDKGYKNITEGDKKTIQRLINK